MSNAINECPECNALVGTREFVDWGRKNVYIVYICDDCRIEFVTELSHPVTEVTRTIREN